MRFAYLTGDTLDAMELPKVYLACHPDDLTAYRDAYRDMLLAHTKCAVCYDTEPEAPYDTGALQDALEAVALIIVPVTKKLLAQPSRARDFELRFAIARRRPILPLMEEPGLREAYTRLFGSLQSLDPHQQDSSSDSFEKKLDDFLEHVLVGGELRARIYAAFDGRVFLSYRKKDRRLAKALMGRLHAQRPFEALGIWYDEYLTPGESFHSGIRHAMDESDLVLLAVTPSLLEPDNYVCRVEYPAAQRTGKPVFPAELAPTDRAALGRMYPALPPVWEASDEAAMLAALQEALQSAGVRFAARERGPEQKYLLGMACLTGTGMEPDRDRGVGFLAEAARSGWAEAAIQLREMFRLGQYVEPSTARAADWAARAMTILDERFRIDRTEAGCAALMRAARSAGDLYRQVSALEKAQSCYAVMADAAGRLAKVWGSDEGERLYALAQADMGILWHSRGDTARAAACLEQARDAMDARDRRLGTLQSAWDLAQVKNLLAGVFKTRGISAAGQEQTALLARAEGLYREAVDLLRPWAEGNPGAMRNLAVYCANLGMLLAGTHRPEPAKEHLAEAYRLFTRLADASMEQAQWYEAESYCVRLQSVVSCLLAMLPAAEAQQLRAEFSRRVQRVRQHTGWPG